ncbi:HAMP domain-containing histidine kinase [Tessaracoccus sp. OS52]|nr:HAMP domain-containing histidine kinase [Tessaracoccus sp. OS52]
MFLTLGSSFIVLVLAGLLLLNQATAGIVETKKDASVAEATGIHAFMQQQLRLPESRNVAVYEQLSRLADLAGAQSGRYKVVIQGPASVLVSADIRSESVPPSLVSAVEAGTGMFVTPTRVVFTDEARPSEPGWAVGTVLVDSSGERFPVYYIFPMTSEVSTIQALQGAVVSTGLALLGALAGIAYLVTVTVVRPVRKASQTALRLASGNLDERMVVRGTDDIASLAESMNEMADDLQQRIRELETLSAVQRRFVSDVSHELRTPLTTMRMAAEVIHDARGAFPPQPARAAELMYSEIERFDSMLQDLLEISRFDAGAAVLTLDEVNFSELVRSEVEAHKALAEREGTTIRFSTAGDETAMMDSRRIRRILRNLLVNAIEHGEGRPVDVTVAADDDAVAVTVRDRGVGFPAAHASHVFERFWRADPSRTRVVGGTGLGLAISMEDARLHKGWLSAWGRPGRGAQFRLTLPREPDHQLTSSPLPVIPTDITARRTQ